MPSSEEGWEERMAARAAERQRLEAAARWMENDPFAPWRLPDDDVDRLPAGADR